MIPLTDDPVIRPDVAEWLEGLGRVPGDPVRQEMEERARETGFPILGPEVGRLIDQLVRLTGATRIFEMGSGFGYSALWFARAAGPEATIWYTEVEDDLLAAGRAYLDRAGVADRVTFLEGDAVESLRATEGTFDIVLCDIDKASYPRAYGAFRERVRPGGLVLADNLIWKGRVAAGDDDESTRGIREYVRRMWADPAYRSSLLPVRDGVGLSLRRSES